MRRVKYKSKEQKSALYNKEILNKAQNNIIKSIKA